LINILRTNCVPQKFIEGKVEERIEVTKRRVRRCEQLLDDLKDVTGHWKLKRKQQITLCGQHALE